MSSPAHAERRILVLAPLGRDAALACEVLRQSGLAAEACQDISALCESLEAGAGALLLAEEALSPEAQRRLSELLGRQPPWSDLPILLFTATTDSRASHARMQLLLDVLGNVTFVERPVRVATLVSAVKAALRARHRQYAARQILLTLERGEEEARHRADFEQQLIGIVSHDLRNPINAITLAAEMLLRREGLPEREKGLAARILSSADRTTRMIRDLLDFTQARLGGGIRIELKAVDLHAMAREAVEEVAVAHPERRILFEGTGEAWGEWDADRLVQVLTNLLTNAVTYSPKDSLVKVTARDEGSAVVLEVHNAGPPIPPERLPSIFQPMQRAATRTDPSSRSVGLGLYIVQHIVRAHGGTIEVRSDEAAGTTFTVRLPRAPAAARRA